MRPAPSRLRLSCSVGLFAASASVILLAGSAAHADGGSPASPDDLVLDLGGATLDTRKVTHGVFTQGSLPTEPGHDRDEEPPHQVTITKDFWIGKTPVTRGQFAKFVADTRYVTDAEKGGSGGSGWEGKPLDGGKGIALVQKKDFNWHNPGFTQTDEHPVVLVSYGDATAFVGWASRKSGKRVRLPTEAEWEFAARGGTTTPWYGGSAAESDPTAFGWFKGNSGNGTRPVAQKKPNPLGIYDLSGNVFEWCRDVYAPYHEGALVDPEVTVVSAGDTDRRVLRGGSWLNSAKRARSASRYRNTPGSRNADNGFRVVVTSEEAVSPGLGPANDFVPASPLGASGGSGAEPAGKSTPGGSLTDGEAAHVEPAGPGGDGFSWGLLLAAPLGAASAVVAWMLLRRKRGPVRAVAPAATTRTTRPTAAPGISTRAGADGFFVRAPSVPSGSRVRYACMVGGTEVTDVVPLDGAAETFVYTGSPPSAIRILEVLTAARGDYRTPDRPIVVPLVIDQVAEPMPSAPFLDPILSDLSELPPIPSSSDALPPDAPSSPVLRAPPAPGSAPSPPSSAPAVAPSSAPALASTPDASAPPTDASAQDAFLGHPRAY